MNFTRRQFNCVAIAALGSAVLPAFAADLVRGRDYDHIDPPQPGDDPAKIEVLEFFSYGCPHCKDLNPLVSRWLTTLPEDVAFKRVPVGWGRAAWANLARLYYALEATGDLKRLDDAVFRAIHDERVSLFSEKTIADWVTRRGLDAKRFAAAYDSAGTRRMLTRGEELTRNYKVEGVPLLTVDGGYAVTALAAKGFADHLAITDGLIGLARSARQQNTRAKAPKSSR